MTDLFLLIEQWQADAKNLLRLDPQEDYIESNLERERETTSRILLLTKALKIALETIQGAANISQQEKLRNYLELSLKEIEVALKS